MLGLSSANALSALLRALAAGDAAQMIRLADEMVVESVSFGEALRGLAAMLHKIALLQRVKEAVAADDPEYPELAELAALLSPEEVQLYYQIALTGRNDLALAPDEYAGFTMALLRMLAFKPAGLRNVPPQRTPEPARAALSPSPQSAPQAPPRPTQSLQAAPPPMMEEPPPFIPDNPGAGGGEPRAG